MTRRRRFLAAAVAVLAVSQVVAQDRAEPVPKALARVGIGEKLDAPLPLQLVFTDERGRDVTLGSYFKGPRPVVLTLNYYRCPMLCTLELNGLVEGLKGLAWTPGDEFEIVTVSTIRASGRSWRPRRRRRTSRTSPVGGRWHFTDRRRASRCHRGRGLLLRVRRGD
jgi:protein SCO1/2